LSRDDLSGAHKKRGAEYAPSVASDIIERLLLVDIELFPQLPLWKLDLNQSPPAQTHGPIHCDKGDKGRLFSCPTDVIPGINIARTLERMCVFVGRKQIVAVSTAALSRIVRWRTAFGLEAFDARMRAFATTFDLWPLAESNQRRKT
jgi:hypothetical protein